MNFKPEYDNLEPIDVTPSLKEKGSILLLYFLGFVFRFSPLFILAISWYLYGFYVSIFLTLSSYIVLNIIFSKIRQEAISSNQNEYNFSDFEILHRFLYYRGFN